MAREVSVVGVVTRVRYVDGRDHDKDAHPESLSLSIPAQKTC